MKYSIPGTFFSEECKASLYEENSYFMGFFGMSSLCMHIVFVLEAMTNGGALKVKYFFVKKALSIMLVTFVV